MSNLNIRLLGGTLLAYLYNALIGRIPSRHIRDAFLSRWLGSFGEGSGIQTGCRFLNGRKVHLGERNVINFGCLLDGRKYFIRTGNDVSIGPEASILTLGHDPQSSEFTDQGAGVVIGNHVWIGYKAIILPGVSIGDGAVIGAGAVIAKNVEPFSIMIGNPAKKIGERNKEIRYNLKYRPFLI